ncbi:MAG: SLAC1 anion channel family protein [Nocardioides sp.]|nr:SLAC1 anion channel family protein [Nocardioides sp.]
MTETTHRQSLAHLPVPLFAAVMGLGGTALAWRRASLVWAVPEWVALVFLGLAVVAMVVVAGAYVAKWVTHPHAAAAELRHPMRIAFVPTVTIAILVVATAAQDVNEPVATGLWWIGAVGHLIATVWVLSEWSTRPDIGAGHITPAWFIPVVGNVVTPLAAPTIGDVDLGWFAFGVGVVFWIALLPLVLERVLTHDQVFPPKLLPTWAVFIAPPSVALLSWHSLTGDLDGPVPRVLYAASVMFLVLVLAQWRRLRTAPFGVPWWAYTFPFAAVAAAAVAMAGARGTWPYEVVAATLLAWASLVVLAVLGATLRLLARGRLLVPEA